MGLKTVVRDAVYEQSSFEIQFDCYEKDGTTAVNPSAVKVYVYITGTENSPTYVNNRDGTTNTDGITINSNNVLFHMSPSDNQIVGTGDFADLRFEKHTVLIEVQYNSGADKDYFEWELSIKNVRPVT